jgi:hypothetical protein
MQAFIKQEFERGGIWWECMRRTWSEKQGMCFYRGSKTDYIRAEKHAKPEENDCLNLRRSYLEQLYILKTIK